MVTIQHPVFPDVSQTVSVAQLDGWLAAGWLLIDSDATPV